MQPSRVSSGSKSPVSCVDSHGGETAGSQKAFLRSLPAPRPLKTACPRLSPMWFGNSLPGQPLGGSSRHHQVQGALGLTLHLPVSAPWTATAGWISSFNLPVKLWKEACRAKISRERQRVIIPMGAFVPVEDRISGWGSDTPEIF